MNFTTEFFRYTIDNVDIKVFLVPDNTLQEISIRICLKAACRDTKYAKLEFKRFNFFLVFSNFLAPFDVENYQEFEIVCNYKREKFTFYKYFNYKATPITAFKFAWQTLSMLPSYDYSFYINNFNFYAANAPYYFNYD